MCTDTDNPMFGGSGLIVCQNVDFRGRYFVKLFFGSVRGSVLVALHPSDDLHGNSFDDSG